MGFLESRLFDKSREVQERWWRMRLHKKFSRKIKAIILWRLHRRLEKEFKTKEPVINSVIETTVKWYRKTDESIFPATKEFYNIGLYFLLAERDIQAVKADAFAHPNETKRNIALRTLLLTIYEWDMGKVTGRRMGNIYQVTNLSEVAKSDFVNALKEVRKAREAIKNELSVARHHTIAHREPDAIRQYEIISNLEIMKFSETLTEFYQASDLLLKAMTQAMLEMGSMPNIFHQLVNQKKVYDK